MSDAVKIGSALAGGYLLGRTKKAKMAIGLAMWLAGKGRPRDWIRQGAITLAQTPEMQSLVKQARGPLLDSARGAATSTVNAQLGSFADNLNQRTGLGERNERDLERGLLGRGEVPGREGALEPCAGMTLGSHEHTFS